MKKPVIEDGTIIAYTNSNDKIFRFSEKKTSYRLMEWDNRYYYINDYYTGFSHTIELLVLRYYCKEYERRLNIIQLITGYMILLFMAIFLVFGKVL